MITGHSANGATEVALDYIRSSEFFQERYGKNFEIKVEGENSETTHVFLSTISSGDAILDVRISQDEWRFELTKNYLKKWKIDRYYLFDFTWSEFLDLNEFEDTIKSKKDKKHGLDKLDSYYILADIPVGTVLNHITVSSQIAPNTKAWNYPDNGMGEVVFSYDQIKNENTFEFTWLRGMDSSYLASYMEEYSRVISPLGRVYKDGNHYIVEDYCSDDEGNTIICVSVCWSQFDNLFCLRGIKMSYEELKQYCIVKQIRVN